MYLLTFAWEFPIDHFDSPGLRMQSPRLSEGWPTGTQTFSSTPWKYVACPLEDGLVTNYRSWQMP